MKFDKSTKILVNTALILVIALLLKMLITFPRNADAASRVEYKVINIEEFGAEVNAAKFTQYINQYALSGWRLHSLVPWAEVVIFER